MAKKLDPRLLEILTKYDERPEDALWDCHGTWVAYHKAIERIAAKAGVKFEMPLVIEANSSAKVVSIAVSGTMGDRSEWSFGEASPANNKNAYPYAMAEKRAKDRVVLKLVGLHGLVYSEEESDDFKPNEKPEPTGYAGTVADMIGSKTEPPRKANGLPEKGWREDGTKTSYALKTEGSWEKLKAELDSDLADCHTLVALEAIKTIYRTKAIEQHWNKQFLAALLEEFQAHERSIMATMEADELAGVPLDTALRQSLKQNVLNAG